MLPGGFIGALMLLSNALAAAGTRSSNIVTAPVLVRRDERVGTACSPEGQWNCMPDTWQRCAAGQWSEVMHLADGTICTPEGLTGEFSIEHDGSVNGDGGQSAGHANSLTTQTYEYMSLAALVVLTHWRGSF